MNDFISLMWSNPQVIWVLAIPIGVVGSFLIVITRSFLVYILKAVVITVNMFLHKYEMEPFPVPELPGNDDVITKMSLIYIGCQALICLAMYSNYWPVYLLAIFFIATLVTDANFIAKIAAIFLNNSKYFDNELAQIKLNQQQYSPSEVPSILSSTSSPHSGEGSETISPPSNNYLKEYHFERMYRLIFTSQIKILEMSRIAADVSVVRSVYDSTILAKEGYSFDAYIKFLVDNRLLAMTDSGYLTTSLGQEFLNYLVDNKIPLQKNGDIL